MRNVKVAIETANLNGFVYDASFQLHHKKPGTSVMHRDLKQVERPYDRSKTCFRSYTPSVSHLRRQSYNGCLPPEGFFRYKSRRIGQMERQRSWQGVEGPTRLDHVKQDEQAKKKARYSPASSGSRK
jgi:hypothetical protein